MCTREKKGEPNFHIFSVPRPEFNPYLFVQQVFITDQCILYPKERERYFSSKVYSPMPTAIKENLRNIQINEKSA